MRVVLLLVVLGLMLGACGGDQPSRAGASPTAAAPRSPPAETMPATVNPVLAYRDETGRFEVRYAQPLQRIGRLIEGLQSESPFWRMQFQANVNELAALGREVRQLMPPPCYAGAHQQFLTMADTFDTAAERTNVWATTGDAQALVDAVRGVNEGNRLLREARMRVTTTRC
jgi:hypothetical protein